jgi:predicted secreted protein
MNITAAIISFAVIWFLVLFMVLPLRMKTQGEAQNVVPGTPSSAPADPQMKRKFKITTAVTFVLWVIFASIILSGKFTLNDIANLTGQGT